MFASNALSDRRRYGKGGGRYATAEMYDASEGATSFKVKGGRIAFIVERVAAGVDNGADRAVGLFLFQRVVASASA